MPESVRNNARIPTYLGRSNQVDVAGGTETIRASKLSRDRDSALPLVGKARTRVPPFRSGWRVEFGTIK